MVSTTMYQPARTDFILMVQRVHTIHSKGCCVALPVKNKEKLNCLLNPIRVRGVGEGRKMLPSNFEAL